jgi:hypothetical protein
MMFAQHKTNQGSALISAAIGAAILSIVAASLLNYLGNEHNLNVRSRVWNQALHLAEAGIEIGFAETNNQFYRGGQNFSTSFQSSRGWSGTNGVYQKTVTNYLDSRSNIVGNISITVEGPSSQNPTITSISTCPTRPGGPPISRAVRATLYASSMFPVGLMSKDFLDMNGNKIYVDSYDSTDGFKSTGGLYDAAKKQSNGNIASNGTLKDSYNIGNAEIYGVAYTGPSGTLALGSNGSVGTTFVSSNRATTVATGEAAGWIQHDFNVDVADVTLPDGATSWSSPPGSTGNSISKDITITGGNYKVNGISLSSNSKKDEIVIDGNVRLYVTGNVSLTGLSQVTILPGSSLQVYVAGSVTVTGNGVVNNNVQPIKNQWYGLTSSASWTVNGNGYWNGVMYAPQAQVSFRGGGANGNASGSVVANRIVMTGHTQFHYDESLRMSDTGAGYTVVTWIELRQSNGVWGI